MEIHPRRLRRQGRACRQRRRREASARARQDLPSVKQVIGFDAEGDDGYKALLAKGAKNPAPVTKVSKDDAASVIYTSGTTGNPKGVVLTHWNLATNIEGLRQVVPLEGNDRTLSFLPWRTSWAATSSSVPSGAAACRPRSARTPPSSSTCCPR
jgi:long-subunit acyl-CoA synthetase (AMP-forming)